MTVRRVLEVLQNAHRQGEVSQGRRTAMRHKLEPGLTLPFPRAQGKKLLMFVDLSSYNG